MTNSHNPRPVCLNFYPGCGYCSVIIWGYNKLLESDEPPFVVQELRLLRWGQSSSTFDSDISIYIFFTTALFSSCYCTASNILKFGLNTDHKSKYSFQGERIKYIKDGLFTGL